MAPLAGALAAVGVSVVLTLAKTQLQQRRAAHPDDVPHPDVPGPGVGDRDARHRDRRRPALYRREPTAEGLRRVVLGQLDLAIELLESYRGGDTALGGGEVSGDTVVHDTRKALKRLRALLRLLRAELGDKRYRRERTALRDCGRRLAGARDAEVMIATLDSLVLDGPGRLRRSHAVGQMRAQLLAERSTAAAQAVGDPRVRAEVLAELRAVRARAERWKLRPRGFKLVAGGLEGIYRRGRSQRRVARHTQSVEALHVWRKHVKELRYAAETLDRGGKRLQPVRRIARRADRLGEMLGEEHDLALLEARVRHKRSRALFAGERATRKRLLKSISQRRRRLRRRALREGERLYRRPARRFVRHVKRVR